MNDGGSRTSSLGQSGSYLTPFRSSGSAPSLGACVGKLQSFFNRVPQLKSFLPVYVGCHSSSVRCTTYLKYISHCPYSWQVYIYIVYKSNPLGVQLVLLRHQLCLPCLSSTRRQPPYWRLKVIGLLIGFHT